MTDLLDVLDESSVRTDYLRMSVDGTTLAELLPWVAKRVEPRATGTLAAVRFLIRDGILHLRARDLDVIQSASLELLDHSGNGLIYLPANLLASIAGNLSGDTVSIEVVGSEAVLRGKDCEYRLICIPDGGEEDVLETQALLYSAHLPGTVFTKAVDQVLPCVSKDMGRVSMTGVNIVADSEGLQFWATDSYRIAKKLVPVVGEFFEAMSDVVDDEDEVGDDSASALVPARALSALNFNIGAADECVFQIYTNLVKISVANRSVTTRLIANEFPKLARLFDSLNVDQMIKVDIERKRALASLKQVAPYSAGSANYPVIVTTGETGISFSIAADNVGKASSHISGPVVPETKRGYNVTFLTVVLSSFVEDVVSMRVGDSVMKPNLFSNESEDLQILLMAVRPTQ